MTLAQKRNEENQRFRSEMEKLTIQQDAVTLRRENEQQEHDALLELLETGPDAAEE